MTDGPIEFQWLTEVFFFLFCIRYAVLAKIASQLHSKENDYFLKKEDSVK